jgi:hypothetical protein
MESIINNINNRFANPSGKVAYKGGSEKVPVAQAVPISTATSANLVPPSITLDKDLTSYKLLILFFFIFCIVVVFLYIFNPKGLTKVFGYEMALTAPLLLLLAFLVKEVIVFKDSPSKSFFSSFSQSSQPWFLPAIILMIVLIGLAGFISILAIGGIFSDKPPENNTAMLLNVGLMLVFLIIVAIFYTRSKKKDDDILESFPKAIQEVFALRTKYTAMFFVFVLVVVMLYLVNPGGIMTDYGGPVLFFSLFVGMILMILITVYQYYMANPSKGNLFKDEQGFLSYLTKGLYILAALGISGGLIFGALKMMGVFNQNASDPESWGHVLFNLILFCAMLGIIYKLANAGGFLDKNPYYRLVLNTLLYIPCLLVNIFNYLGQVIGVVNGAPGSGSTFTPPKPFEYKMLILSLVLLGGYFVWIFLGKPFLRKRYLKQGGQQLVNQPIQTDVLNNIASYQTLSGKDSFNYQYAISFWFYLDSFPPSTNSSYLKVVPILSYGENPSVKYSSADNTLYITVKQTQEGDHIIDYVQQKEKEIKPEAVEEWKTIQDNINQAIEKVKEMPFGNDIDADGHRIIYKQQDVLLQKWNHIVLNYNGGTLDVFYNGKLVKSAIEVVPYMKFDMLTVGTENGISGNVANLLYFKQPLDILTINTLYTSLKDKNPPSIPENKEKLIPLKTS